MAQATLENGSEWILSSLTISHYAWEKNAPYQGKIAFHNKDGDSLGFNIPQEKMAALLAIIADSVVDSAKSLGSRIAQSVPSMIAQAQPAIAAALVIEDVPAIVSENSQPATE